ncbi:hypothetical protein [Xanthomonas phage XPV1]|uniref:Phage neck terminator protein gp12-like domain-containing protein n=1 Tax=Xanthomonas phage XPV1 TaxID=2099860 RepID=A0A3S7I6D1_9CAUD|nr:hypothetical protein KEM12_gp63 [Xanthomonas phage XPV1]AVO24227.1 hypothetical protein [Xanthomonas phage XPV1]
MTAATLTPTEDAVFDAMFGFVAKILDLPDDTQAVIKGFQNLSSTPTGSYVVVSPGMMTRQDFGSRLYDPGLSKVVIEAHLTYSYQVDCYGPLAPTWASAISVAWKSMWGVDNTAPAFAPLYADAPQQLNIVNSEGQYEQRFMVRLFGQVNQRVSLPQDFFSDAQLTSLNIADLLP